MWERLVYWGSLEYIAEKQKIDHIDLLVYLLSKHKRFRIKVIAGNFLVHASDTEVLIENYQIYKQRTPILENREKYLP